MYSSIFSAKNRDRMTVADAFTVAMMEKKYKFTYPDVEGFCQRPCN